jgi:hypothetical protein
MGSIGENKYGMYNRIGKTKKVKNDVLQIGPQLVQEKPHWASNLIYEAQISPQMLVTFYSRQLCPFR